MKLRIIKISTRYWRPGTHVIDEILTSVNGKIKEGDFLVISEKALAIALSHVIDESKVTPGVIAYTISNVWMRKIWGGLLGKATRLKRKTLDNLKNYPRLLGARHKQLTIIKVGLLESLRHYSEGGIDASNLPYSFISLPLPSPEKIAVKVREKIKARNGIFVNVIIADGDSTFSWRNIHLSPRKIRAPGFIFFGGFISFLIGRMFSLRPRPTPIAYAGEPINSDRMLWFTMTAHKATNTGGGRTVWGMSARFNTGLTEITYEMLDSVQHTPIIILRALELRKDSHPEHKIGRV